VKARGAILLALVLLLLAPVVHREDWKIKDTTYHNVQVSQVKTDTLSITLFDGAGRINLSDLTAGFQTKLRDAASASPEELISRVEEVKTHKILKIEQVHLEDAAPRYFTAVLVQTDIGERVVLLTPGSPGSDWTYRIFQAGQ